MAIEIERKFRVQGDGWRSDVISSSPMRQGYLNNGGNTSLRVRISGDRANINIKSGGIGIRRLEYEYEIPLQDGLEMLAELAQGALVEKTRHKVRCGNHIWDLDVFEGANAGLVVAEVELDAEDEVFHKPDWAGQEVSDDPRYYNVNLIENPYCNWKTD
ncbi:MAG: CYTH domain-containing protein [Gammaproteobacteria bacterium SHHR-1]|uniref:CYTH domain-containing protein n=1 Tax=Magnetovirga frankeli TaxID=947516 RepID=UPI001293EBD0|nr:CYTH domain-containing protein [gamma proteobacterium SS-5]